MDYAINETKRRRKIQAEYNLANHITPKSIKKAILDPMKTAEINASDVVDVNMNEEEGMIKQFHNQSDKDLKKDLKETEREMHQCAENLEFEKAAKLRDKAKQLKNMILKSK